MRKTHLYQLPRIGTRKLHHLLKAPLSRQNMALGRDALFDVLRQARLLVPPGRAYHKTTNSHHRFRRHPNLLKPGPEQVQANRSEQLWVADNKKRLQSQPFFIVS